MSPAVPRILVLVAALGATARADHDSRADRGHLADGHAPGVIGVSGGAGMNGFVGGEARGVIGPGLGWELRITTLDNRHVRAELSYLGSTQALVDSPGVALRAHGVQGSLRVNVAPSLAVEPFVYLGAGWSRFTVTRDDVGMFGSPDNVLDIPFGIGAAYHVGAFVVDLRAAISVVTGAELVHSMDAMGSANLSRFSLRASLGVEL